MRIKQTLLRCIIYQQGIFKRKTRKLACLAFQARSDHFLSRTTGPLSYRMEGEC